MTLLQITLNKGLPEAGEIAVNEIKSVLFDGEPSELAWSVQRQRATTTPRKCLRHPLCSPA